ncbi:NAD(P)-dependent dehydrogenase (short-subunit alcohol dehydrogenase family) [Sphingomonas xinjiangensis]|uniref:NAD(P)-dependent dehydrogenase (Short-subunit alcohol dehydrogenase family) n=1 Tax=Sphingomonas xinjiangensis TaxID=643568 RepID=A0A840YNA0_9SPHN|nr:NAD(P)-dependent dehydrogenase (short-subunit alcohol dehydrogenase family) [Sphingomonas xinjiangensis]
MLGTGPEREGQMQALVADTPLRRFGLPDEVAALAATLASDEAAYVTGTEINIGGGLLDGSAAAPG